MRTYEQRQSRSGNRSTEIQRLGKACYEVRLTKRTRRSESVNEKFASSLTEARKIASDWRVA